MEAGSGATCGSSAGVGAAESTSALGAVCEALVALGSPASATVDDARSSDKATTADEDLAKEDRVVMGVIRWTFMSSLVAGGLLIAVYADGARQRSVGGGSVGGATTDHDGDVAVFHDPRLFVLVVIVEILQSDGNRDLLGLAGRKVRPGCGSPYYGAPEVWDMSSFGDRVDPRATDVYAFCCLAFELMTGKPLFAGDSLPAIFAAHLSHDGNPEGLEWMRKHDRHGPLAELLSAGLVREPSKRLGMSVMRARLLDLAKERLTAATWPLRP